MKWLALAFVAACGSKSPPPKDPDPVPPGPTSPVKDTRTELEKRRDAACDVVAKRNTECAVKEAKANVAAGKVKQEQFDKDTKPEILAKNTAVYADKCKAKKDYSSRQIRVLEKCPQYETECEPFLRCLDNVQPEKK